MEMSIISVIQSVENRYPFFCVQSIPSPHMIAEMEHTEYDVAVIGGGCTGSMIALDASLRGYKVILFERCDFASGTSSRSTNLLHGGIRYLENAFRHCDWKEFRLVKVVVIHHVNE